MAERDAGSMGGVDRARVFAEERPRLVGLAYRMLGSVAEAEDVVSVAWDRFAAAEGVVRPKAWLTTVTSRLAIDRLRSEQRRREEYVGPWLPEPVITATASRPAEDPGERAELSESLTLGFLVVLDRLGPVERAVFLLADVFGEPYRDIAAAVGRSEEACRQIASRARRRVREERAARAAADEDLLASLVGALAAGDVNGVLSLLSPGVVMVSDGGPDRRAARRPVVGPDRVARLLLNLTSRMAHDAEMSFAEVNAATALVIRSQAEGHTVLTAEGDPDGRIVAIRLLLNPEKLRGLEHPPEIDRSAAAGPSRDAAPLE